MFLFKGRVLKFIQHRSLERATEIFEYIAQEKPPSAEKWIDEVFKRVERSAVSHEMGRMVPEISDSRFRELIYGNYRIVCRLAKQQISILTIRHSKQILPIREINS
jgi:toxin ParE1/3/4